MNELCYYNSNYRFNLFIYYLQAINVHEFDLICMRKRPKHVVVYHKELSSANDVDRVQQLPAVCASAHGCSPCRAASGAPEFMAFIELLDPFNCDCCDPGCVELPGGAKPLLMASACRDIIRRLAAWRSASRSSAVWRLKKKETNKNHI